MNLANISASKDDMALSDSETCTTAVAAMADPEGDEDDPAMASQLPEHRPKELICWRHAVTNADNLPQLMCCLLQLNKCIAWEKSVMRVVRGGGYRVVGLIFVLTPQNHHVNAIAN